MFKITAMTASADDTVLTLSWTYTTDAGSRRGNHNLTLPSTGTALEDLTESTLLDWLSDQLPEDVEDQLDAQIARDNEIATIRNFTIIEGDPIEDVD